MTAIQTLLYPFETGLLPMPEAGMRGIVFNAQPDMRRPEGFGAQLALVQGFRPSFLPLQRSGHEVTSEARGEGYDLAFIIAGRHRRQNELWIAEALARTRPGATILVAGGKTDGIASLRKRLADLLPLAGSAAKHHGVVVWIERPEGEVLEAAIASLTPATVLAEDRFATTPGGFSADRVDAGSRLLADSLPPLKGAVADFCAGWGYLSVRLAEHRDVTGIDLYEADHGSLEAARDNMQRLAPAIAATFHWQDLAAEPAAKRYRSIVMNPPFHRGRAADSDIGVAMFDAASKALSAGGRLYLVANIALPYEKALQARFKAIGELARADGFKVLWAER